MTEQRNKILSSAAKNSQRIQPKQSQASKNNKIFRDIILTEKRVSDIQILNTNIKRKLSILGEKTLPVAQYSSRAIKQQSQYETKKGLANSPMKNRLQSRQKYTNQQKNIINEYRRRVYQDSRGEIRNPFEMALVQMIQKEQEIIAKRQRDLEFWRNRVTTLQKKYYKLESRQERLET